MDLHQKKDKRLLSPQEQLGSQWVFIAMCRDTKLIPAFSLDKRTTKVAADLMEQLKARVRGKPRIVTAAFEA